MVCFTAEPPRKDGGVLLLSKLFLDACSSTYSVFPAGQENQGQPFVSKHFNVIDPLRINNNLGRSVSKGAFVNFLFLCGLILIFCCIMIISCLWHSECNTVGLVFIGTQMSFFC